MNPTVVKRTGRKSIFEFIAGLNSSVYLFVATIIALFAANSHFSEHYFAFLDIPISFAIGGFELFSVHGQSMNVGLFVNDVLMVVFFFTVGLEIKHELLEGSLSNFRDAMLPVIAAVGGMLMPVLVYLAIGHDSNAIHGTPIPMATDIAFSLAVLALLGNSVPTTLKVFLMSLAVADDIGGIIVIAVFYSGGIHFLSLGLGILMAVIAYLLGYTKIRSLWLYYTLFFFCWLFFLHSGVHATIAGVLMGLAIPHKPLSSRGELLNKLRWMSSALEEDSSKKLPPHYFMEDDLLEKVFSADVTLTNTYNLTQRMFRQVSPFVNYIVLPLFAFANAGVALGGVDLGQFVGVPLAITLGLVVGKTVGIFGATWLACKTGLAHFPQHMTTKNLFGLSIFGGIGFTVALFLATLAFTPGSVGADAPALLNQAKLGVIMGSLISGILGYITLNAVLKKEHSTSQVTSVPSGK